jgi:hypothetical protein
MVFQPGIELEDACDGGIGSVLEMVVDGAGVGQMEGTCSVGGADGFGSLNCLIRHDIMVVEYNSREERRKKKKQSRVVKRKRGRGAHRFPSLLCSFPTLSLDAETLGARAPQVLDFLLLPCF